MITVKDIAIGLKSNDPVKKLNAVRAVRKILGDDDNTVIDYGSKQDVKQWITIGLTLIPKLTEFLDDASNPSMQLEAAWALRCMSFPLESSEECCAIVSAGAVPKLFGMLKSKHAKVFEQAAGALGNVVHDSSQARDSLLELGLVEILQSDTTKLPDASNFERLAYLAKSLCCSFRTEPISDKIEPLLPILAKMIQSTDEEVFGRICQAYSHFTKFASRNQIQAVVDSGVLLRLVELLKGTSSGTTKLILKTVIQIVNIDVKFIQNILDTNIIPKLLLILNQEDENSVLRALKTIETFMFGNHQQIQKILDSDIMAVMAKYLRQECSNVEIKNSWACAFSNLLRNGSKKQIIKILNQYKIVNKYCDAMLSKDSLTALSVLDGLESLLCTASSDFFCIMLKEIGVIIKLKSLKNHENEEICLKSNSIIETFFSEVQEEDEDKAPEAKRSKIEKS